MASSESRGRLALLSAMLIEVSGNGMTSPDLRMRAARSLGFSLWSSATNHPPLEDAVNADGARVNLRTSSTFSLIANVPAIDREFRLRNARQVSRAPRNRAEVENRVLQRMGECT